MTERKTPAKKAPAKAKQDEPQGERELTAGTAEPAPAEEQADDQADRSVSPPLKRVDEHQSIAADAEYVADDTVEPDPEKVTAEQGKAADVGYLDSRTTHPGHVA